jgi:transposase
MTLFDSYTREQLRQTYADAWRKHLAHSPLTPLEAMITDVVGVHPEYHAVVGDREAALTAAPDASGNSENPFLHMGLHMAVREQVSIDRPPGIRELHRQLQARHGDPHRAEHMLMEALGETLWDAQHAGRPPDEGRYLDLARRRLEDAGRR